MQQPSPLYKRHRFPGEIISHAVWLYSRRHLLPAPQYHQLLQTRFATWRAVTGLPAAA